MIGSLGEGPYVKNTVWGSTQDLPKTRGCVFLVLLVCVRAYVHEREREKEREEHRKSEENNRFKVKRL